jgi:hypothetical protein|tara:strand:- start:422 stop:862 length:441 start_codon:yes stop_codon:yes gene_type:complete
MYTIKQILDEGLLSRFDEIKNKIDKALVYSDGEWTSYQIVKQAIANPGLFQVWDILDKRGQSVAIATTRFLEYNSFNSIHIITLGGIANGDFPLWAEEFEKIIKEFPQVDYLEFTGRRGLVKGLTKVGWNEKYTTMRKQLKGDNNV